MKLTDQTLKQQDEVSVEIVLRKENIDPFRLWKVYPDINDVREWQNFSDQKIDCFQAKIKAAENH